MDKIKLAKDLTKVAKLIIGEDSKTETINYIRMRLERLNDTLKTGDFHELQSQLQYLLKNVNHAVEQEQSKVVGGLVGETVRAFGDGEERSLNWHGKYTNATETVQQIIAALSDGYNEFNAKKVVAFVKTFSNYKFRLAREGSPSLYIRGFSTKEEANKMAAMARKIYADEIHVEIDNHSYSADPSDKDANYAALDNDLRGAELRLWWD